MEKRRQLTSMRSLIMWLCACGASALAAPPVAPTVGIEAFVNSRDPPFYSKLDATTLARAQLGHAVFNTQFVPAGTAGAARIDGLGPLFNSVSCDECHNEGADARGPRGDGPAPQNLVLELQRPGVAHDVPNAGDAHYGQVLNTASLPALEPEASVTIKYRLERGHYPDGTAWELRDPQYFLSELRYGPLAADTLIKPRLAPPLFGDGLLEAVPASAVTDASGEASGVPAWQRINGRRELGRFGWQGSSVSIREQTGKAMAREMGLTNPMFAHDDCTPNQTDCRSQPNGGAPEVSPQLFDAVVEFVRWLAVPAVPAAPASFAVAAARGPGAALFAQLGCSGCHRPVLPVVLPAVNGARVDATITAYTDLRLHDLGLGLADRDASGQRVRSLFRTAPLWGLGYRVGREQQLTLLHDGRARSTEEAILWHDGEASSARNAFERLSASKRQALLSWLAAR
jgi:CxxC motif-containing protein (DUF1111 family)